MAALEALGTVEEQPDAIVLACFGDPGLEALRERAGCPVVCMVDASINYARSLGYRPGIVTGGASWQRLLPPMLRRLGIDGQVPISCLEANWRTTFRKEIWGRAAPSWEDTGGAVDSWACIGEHGRSPVAISSGGRRSWRVVPTGGSELLPRRAILPRPGFCCGGCPQPPCREGPLSQRHVVLITPVAGVGPVGPPSALVPARATSVPPTPSPVGLSSDGVLKSEPMAPVGSRVGGPKGNNGGPGTFEHGRVTGPSASCLRPPPRRTVGRGRSSSTLKSTAPTWCSAISGIGSFNDAGHGHGIARPFATIIVALRASCIDVVLPKPSIPRRLRTPRGLPRFWCLRLVSKRPGFPMVRT